jgi:cytochrome d ubiquinol oxidase subunit I
VTLEDGTIGERVAGLRTSDGVSEVVTAEQVLGSIVMFGLLYGLLLVLWLYVLNGKIQAGPHGREHADTARGEKDLLDAAGSRVASTGSLTGGRD